MLPFARSRLEITPSITSFILRTPSSSFCKASSLACSASYRDSPGREADVLVLSSDLEFDFEEDLLVAREGEAQRSSLSASERSSLSICKVAMVYQIQSLRG